jgi:excinuclease ABC subunit B
MIEGARDFQDVQLQLKAAQEQARYESMSEKQLAREIRRLEKQMLDHARNLEFEKAAEARDRLAELKRSVFGAAPEETAPAVG